MKEHMMGEHHKHEGHDNYRALSGEHMSGEAREHEENRRKDHNFGRFHVYSEKVGGHEGDRNREGAGRAEQRREHKYE